MVKISVSVDSENLRLAKAWAKEEGTSLSAILARGLRNELDARARLEAGLALYGRDGWPTEQERRKLVGSWSRRTSKPRAKRTAA